MTQPTTKRNGGIWGTKVNLSLVCCYFPDVTVRNFLLNFVYKDSTSELLRVERDNRVENEGRFQIELSDALTGTLDKIEFSDNAYQGKVKASLCSIN
jgi:hypothetical protein